MNIFDYILRQKKSPEFGTGALIDNRTSEAQESDIFLGEIVARANAVDWSQKNPDEWRRFPERNQGRGNTCMANAYAKTRGVLSEIRDGKFIEFSAADVYRRRANKPGAGMYLYDLFEIGGEGITLEALVSSDQLTDDQVDAIKVEPHETKVGEVFATDDKPIYIPNGDFESAASVIQTTGKAITAMFYFTAEEYSRQVPVRSSPLGLYDSNALHHGIALVDAFTYQGVQYIRAEDSAWFGGFKERLLTRDFFTSRNFGMAYDMGFKFDEGSMDRPHFDGSIVSLQKCLRYEGFFPSNVDYAEHIGPVTTEAVRKYQVKYGIEPSFGVFGSRTRADVTTRFP